MKGANTETTTTPPRLPDAQQAVDTARRADIALISTNLNCPGEKIN